MVWVVLLAAFSLLFAVWGYVSARARGRSAVLWAVVCALTFFIGIAIVYSLNEPLTRVRRRQREPDEAGDTAALSEGHTVNDNLQLPDQGPVQLAEPMEQRPVSISTGESAEARRWRYLMEYHPDIDQATRRIQPLGERALGELKTAYLTLNDSTLLPAIVRRIEEKFGSRMPERAPPLESRRATARSAKEDEPIELAAPRATERSERRAEPVSGLASARLSRSDTRQAGPDKAQPRDDVTDLDSEQSAWRAAYDKADGKPSEPISVTAATSSLLDELTIDGAGSTEHRHSANGLANSSINGSSDRGLAKDAPNGRLEQRRDDARSLRVQTPPPEEPATHRPPQHRTVAPDELAGARYVETHGGLHLFALTDGRVFVDRHEALGSLEQARDYIDGLKARHPRA